MEGNENEPPVIDDVFLKELYFLLDIQEGLDCFLYLPELDNPEQSPLNYENIKEQQQLDQALLELLES